MAFFQQRHDKGYFSNSTAAESYQLTATVYPMMALSLEAANLHLPIVLAWVCVILILECVQYQFWNVIVRPAVDPEYKRYSTPRTLVILLLQYFQIIFAFALIYRNLFPMMFHVSPKVDAATTLSPLAAIEFSAVTMTTVGFGSIYPEPGTAASIVAACEALCGVFGLGLMLASIVSGLREVQDVA
jgi:hypothetical protein